MINKININQILSFMLFIALTSCVSFIHFIKESGWNEAKQSDENNHKIIEFISTTDNIEHLRNLTFIQQKTIADSQSTQVILAKSDKSIMIGITALSFLLFISLLIKPNKKN